MQHPLRHSRTTPQKGERMQNSLIIPFQQYKTPFVPLLRGIENKNRHPERDSGSSLVYHTNTISDSLYSLDSFWLDQYIHPAFGTPQEGKKYKPPFSPPCHGDKYKNIILNLIRSASVIQQIARYSFFCLVPPYWGQAPSSSAKSHRRDKSGARGSCIHIQALFWRVSFQNLQIPKKEVDIFVFPVN